MKFTYRVRTAELDSSYLDDIKDKFPDRLIAITITDDIQERNTEKVLALAGSVDDAAAQEVNRIINEEFGKTGKQQ